MHVSSNVFFEQRRLVDFVVDLAQAVVEMTRLLRQRGPRTGLILANGGVLTYHYAITLSKQPPQSDQSYPPQNPLEDLITDISVPVMDHSPQGEATIEVSHVNLLCFALQYQLIVSCRRTP